MNNERKIVIVFRDIIGVCRIYFPLYAFLLIQPTSKCFTFYLINKHWNYRWHFSVARGKTRRNNERNVQLVTNTRRKSKTKISKRKLKHMRSPPFWNNYKQRRRCLFRTKRHARGAYCLFFSLFLIEKPKYLVFATDNFDWVFAITGVLF